MPMPTYDAWISNTAKTFHKRHAKLQELDDALAAYVGRTKPPVTAQATLGNLITLEKKLNAWKGYNSNRDWTQSIRERKGAVSDLETAIQQEKGKLGLVSAIGAGPFVPKNLTALVASEAINRESAFDQNAVNCTVPTHQRLVYPPGAYPREQPVGSGNWVDNVAPVTINFNWNAKFELVLRRKTLEVIVRIKPKVANTIVGGKFQNTWKTHIQSAWKGASLRSGQDIYNIDFNLQFVGGDYAGDCYEVNVNSVPPPPPPADWRAAQARRQGPVVGGSVGTPDMGNWGGDDSAVIGHEFGHMLGLPDEYYTTQWNNTPVDGSVYNQNPFTTNSIMNNTGKEGRIFKRHFETVKLQFEIWQGLPPHSVEVILRG